MSETSNKMLAQLGLTEQDKEWETLNNNNQIKPETKVISKGEPLFVRLEKEEEIEPYQEPETSLDQSLEA